MKLVSIFSLIFIAALFGAAWAADSPSEVYRAFDTAVRKAQSVKDLLPYLTASKRAELEQLGEAEQIVKLSELRLGRPDKVKIKNEKIKDDEARLNVEGFYEFQELRIKGRVMLLREDGAWKFDGELWDKSS